LNQESSKKLIKILSNQEMITKLIQSLDYRYDQAFQYLTSVLSKLTDNNLDLLVQVAPEHVSHVSRFLSNKFISNPQPEIKGIVSLMAGNAMKELKDFK